MLYAKNKTTGERVKSTFIFKNPSYQFPKKEKWIAPEGYITNWEELKKKGIEEVEVRYWSEALHKRGKKEYVVSPHFKIKEKKGFNIQTIKDNKWHRLAENWIYNEVDKLELIYSTANKPTKYHNSIKLNELPIDYPNQDTEVNIKGGGLMRIADVIFPFLIKHPLFGKGIIFEIQFSKQKPRLEERRTFERTLQGYSVVWLHENDFEKIGKDIILLKDIKVNVFTWASELKIRLPQLQENLILSVQEQCRNLDNKKEFITNEINQTLIKCNNKIQELDNKKDNILNEFLDESKELQKKQIEEFSDSIKEDVIKNINSNFFEDNEEKISNIIEDKVQNWLRIMNKEFIINIIDNNLESIDQDKIISDAKIFAKENIEKYFFRINIEEHPPNCPKCGNLMVLKTGDDWAFWGCSDWKNGCERKIYLSKEVVEKLNII